MDAGDAFTLQVYNNWYSGDGLYTASGGKYTSTRFTTDSLRNTIITNEILTDETTPGLIVYPGQGPTATIGINASDPSGANGRMTGLRVYLNPEGYLNPADLLAPLDGTANAGVTLRNPHTNTNIPLAASTWQNDLDDSLVYHPAPSPPSPPALR